MGLFILFAIVSGLTTPPSCLRQATVSRGRDRARSGNGTLHVPFPSSQMAKSPPRRGKAFWSAARFVCRMTLYACRSSSHKTRYAIFVGTLKDKKALSRPLHRGGYNKESLKLCCKQGCLAQQDSICTHRACIPAGHLLSNKDNKVRGRKSKLKTTNFTPHDFFAECKKV